MKWKKAEKILKITSIRSPPSLRIFFSRSKFNRIFRCNSGAFAPTTASTKTPLYRY